MGFPNLVAVAFVFTVGMDDKWGTWKAWYFPHTAVV